MSSLENVDVHMNNVLVGMRVRRGRHWRTGRKGWRDDKISSAASRNPVVGAGTVVGFSDERGGLVGRNAQTEDYYNTFHFTRGSGEGSRVTVGPGWCAVQWDSGIEAIYPIGACARHLETGCWSIGKWWTEKNGEVPCYTLYRHP
mmetsp:Transcript_841/g.934  ORF Transcript_841/g.934 Transcript_841/m.934 type:complete len:145 (-) Transcript_841:104-538(-)